MIPVTNWQLYRILCTLEADPSITGFDYAIDLMLFLAECDKPRSIVDGYKYVGSKYGVSHHKVSRNIRTLIESINKDSPLSRRILTHKDDNGDITCSVFVSSILSYLKYRNDLSYNEDADK